MKNKTHSGIFPHFLVPFERFEHFESEIRILHEASSIELAPNVKHPASAKNSLDLQDSGNVLC